MPTPIKSSYLVLWKIGRPLCAFESSKELYAAVHHAIEAHFDAYMTTKILHDDVNAGNILVDTSGNGMLLDWDLCKATSDAQIRRAHRTPGTRQFISVEVLLYPETQHKLRHDLESFFWVLLYHALRYTPSSIPKEDLRQVVDAIFDEAPRRSRKGIWIGGGRTKVDVIRNEPWNESTPPSNFYGSTLGQLLARFRMLMAHLYMGDEARKAALSDLQDSTKLLAVFDSFKDSAFPEDDPSIDRF